MPKQTIIQRGKGEDLFVYMHIEGSYIAEQAKRATSDSVVSELWGAGTSVYRSVIAGYGGWARYVEGLAKTCGKPKFAHVCLTTWSAGSEVIKMVCRGTSLPDAIVSLDGLYGTKPPGSKPGDGNVLFDAGIEAVANFAVAAARGERLFVLLHSSISTPYGSSGEVAARVQHHVEQTLGKAMERDDSLSAVELDKHQFSEALVLGNFHLIEFPGRDAKEHVREAHLFDEVWKKWIPWATTDEGAPVLPASGPEPLALGRKGEDVRAWQHFVIGRGATIKADGDFGPKTKAATVAFQSEQYLDQTGIVDAATIAKAAEHGFGSPKGGPQQPVEDRGPEWPPRPGFQPLVGNAARAAVFGSFKYEPAPTAGNPEGVRILDGWGGANIVMVDIPQLDGITGAPTGGRVAFHRLGANRLRMLFERWEAAGLLPLVLTWAGSWAPRFIRGSRSTLSNHAFGTAFDINAAWNPLGAIPPLAGRHGSVRELVPIANDLGFFWGGHFGVDHAGRATAGGRPDGMHFELATT